MIDLPTQQDMNHPHHRRAIWAMIAASVLLGVVLVSFYSQKETVPEPVWDASARLQKIVGQPVPPANLTPEETAKLKTLVDKPVPPANLTAAQLERLRALQGQ